MEFRTPIVAKWVNESDGRRVVAEPKTNAATEYINIRAKICVGRFVSTDLISKEYRPKMNSDTIAKTMNRSFIPIVGLFIA